MSTWIYRVAVHKALDKLRRKKARLRLHQWIPWGMPDEQKSHAEPFYHPGIELDKKEKAAVLFKAISTLPEKQQLAFTLIKIQGLSYAEVSNILQQGAKAIESLVSRAGKNLQEHRKRIDSLRPVIANAKEDFYQLLQQPALTAAAKKSSGRQHQPAYGTN